MRNMTLLLIVSGVIRSVMAQAPLPEAPQAPDQVALTFYRWYLHELDEGHMPLVQSQKQIREYSSSTLSNSLLPRKGAESRDVDYFLKAQDTLEDWATHVSASPPKVTGDTAQTVITLGASPQTRHELALTLIKEAGRWKIHRVTAIRKKP